MWIGAGVEEELDDRQAAGESGGVEGRAAVATEGFCIGAGVKERPGRVDVADEGCERDQWHPELGVDPGGVGAGRERRSNTGGIPGPDQRGQWRGRPSGHRRCAGGGATGWVRHHPVEEGKQGAKTEDQGDENSLVTLREHRRGTAFLPEHGREEAADEEKQRHPEAMDREKQQPEPGGRLRVLHRPGDARDVGEAGVEEDPEEHRHGAEGIEIVATGIGRGAHRFHSRGRLAAKGAS